MFANYLIGFREGLEASLIVAILLAFVKSSSDRSKAKLIWVGVTLAVALSVSLGAFFSLSIYYLPFESQELIGGFLSLIAAAMILGLIFWMAKHSANLRVEIQEKAKAAMETSAIALVTMAFISVAREGIEVSLFLWNGIVASGSIGRPIFAALTGILSAVSVVWLFYRGAIGIKIKQFFQVTGVLLIFVAAGIAAYGVHDLQEAGVLPGLNVIAFDVSAILSVDSFLGSILSGLFNYTPNPTVLEMFTWISFLLISTVIYLRGSFKSVKKVEAQVSKELINA